MRRNVTDYSLSSLPTCEQVNIQKFYDVLRSGDPELYLIKIALQETGMNPTIIPRIIRAIANLAYGTGFGKVQVFMEEREITQIKPEESDLIGLPAIVDKEVDKG